jgi:hypothetical protein
MGFVITDLVAVGVLAYFNENIKVPEQIAVIGFVIGLCRDNKMSTNSQAMKWVLK